MQSATAPAATNAMLVVTGTEFLLSMVEARWAARNGDGRKMESGLRSAAGIGENRAATGNACKSLPGRTKTSAARSSSFTTAFDDLHAQVSAHFSAWEKTELARNPQRPYPLGLHGAHFHRLE